MANIHPTAVIEEGAVLGKGITIGEFSVIRSGVVLGNDCWVGSFCDLGVQPHPNEFNDLLLIGDGATIRSHSVLYAGSTFGRGLSTGHRIVVRSGTFAGQFLQIGTGTDIEGDCLIGDFVRTHSDVHISQKSRIGNFVWLYPGVILTNDPMPPSNILRGVTIEDFAVIAVNVVVLPGLTVGMGALVGAGSVLKTNADAECLYIGNPAKKIGSFSKLPMFDETGNPAYPWNARFNRGYPKEITDAWG